MFPILLGREVELVEVRRLEREGVVDGILGEVVDKMLGEVGDKMLTGRFNCSTEVAGKLNWSELFSEPELLPGDLTIPASESVSMDTNISSSLSPGFFIVLTQSLVGSLNPVTFQMPPKIVQDLEEIIFTNLAKLSKSVVSDYVT